MCVGATRTSPKVARVEVLSSIVDVFTAVAAWLPTSRDRADVEVNAVLVATMETRAYLADASSKHARRDRDRERELVRLWTRAAVAIRKTDPDLAQRLVSKAHYWISPESWTPEDVGVAQIRIRDIEEEGRMLLKRK